ncbi:PilN domain-containing protein [Lysobacter sp. LF1]|uniref:PilN domain-containing protein n=1 Tax=Lysobacter stagni TaxID=3045172 RepID=A0ABT6XBJ1_9GAMM|nr:PilN domain-containing protein [Lysobacter sp. LF1]MDI9237501.1 PilN domain-containing protein [Lysobacter sp. LF1]
MARINLLPWREERRKQRQKEFAVMFGCFALGAVILSFIIASYYSGQIDGQNERNAYVQQQIDEVKAKNEEIKLLEAKKAKLLARKEVIEKLQANRSQMVHLFDSLVRTIPDGAVLTSIKQDNETLTLEGRAQSNARVSTYMRNLEGSGWMTSPDLSIIEAKGADKGLPYQFKLQVKLANPNAPKDEDGDGVPDAPTPAAQIAQSTGAAATAGAAPAAGAATPAPGTTPEGAATQPAAAPGAPAATDATAPTAPNATPAKGAAS